MTDTPRTKLTFPSGNPVPEGFRFPIPTPPEDLARHYGTELAVIVALTQITEMFGTWPSAQYIVQPYGKSISIPEIAAVLHRLYEAGHAARPDRAMPEPVCPEGHSYHRPKPPEPE